MSKLRTQWHCYVHMMPNKALQTTLAPSLRFGAGSGELGRGRGRFAPRGRMA